MAPTNASLTLPEVWSRAHASQTCELDDSLRVVSGALPSELRGVLYRVGPGRLERGGAPYAHPFDGDGMVARFSFSQDGVRYRNRHVRTREFCAEEAAGRQLFRSFATNLPRGIRGNFLRLAFKNTANTSVVWHADKLLALWKGGLPHLLNADTLDTIERHDFCGALRDRSWLFTREMPFSAHPKIDPVSGELYNFGTLMGYQSKLVLYRIDARGAVDKPTLVPLDRLYFIHDFGLGRRRADPYLRWSVGCPRRTGLSSSISSMMREPACSSSIRSVHCRHRSKIGGSGGN